MDGLRGDVVRVRRLLDDLAEGEPTSQAQRAVVSAAARFSDIAVWNRETFEAQGRKGRVVIPGRFLTGNQVSDDPLLVRAKLNGTLAPLQKEQVKALKAAYQRVVTASTPSPNPAGLTDAHLGVIPSPSV
jgi:hypothetical protein